jgi:hypothetical protein
VVFGDDSLAAFSVSRPIQSSTSSAAAAATPAPGPPRPTVGTGDDVDDDRDESPAARMRREAAALAAEVIYSDEKVANRNVRFWHGATENVIERWKIPNVTIRNFCIAGR